MLIIGFLLHINSFLFVLSFTRFLHVAINKLSNNMGKHRIMHTLWHHYIVIFFLFLPFYYFLKRDEHRPTPPFLPQENGHLSCTLTPLNFFLHFFWICFFFLPLTQLQFFALFLPFFALKTTTFFAESTHGTSISVGVVNWKLSPVKKLIPRDVFISSLSFKINE